MGVRSRFGGTRERSQGYCRVAGRTPEKTAICGILESCQTVATRDHRRLHFTVRRRVRTTQTARVGQNGGEQPTQED